jgi:SEC-C motif
MKISRNELCPCGSGRKYKRCHYRKSFPHPEELSLHSRNRALLNAALDIFGFSQVKSEKEFRRAWVNLKTKISGSQIREFYQEQSRLWTPRTNWAALMPSPDDGKLRALYLGDIRPELILKNLIRFSLYSDELLVIDPFLNPWIISPEYNPIDNPDQHKQDILKLIYFLFQVAPWIESGIVRLIPDPTDFDVPLKRETWRLAMERRADQKLATEDLEEAHEIGFQEVKRALLALPDNDLLRQFEKMGKPLTEEQKKEYLDYARRELRNDPLALEQPLGGNRKDGQLIAMRGGANLETALIIGSQTGAFPYTNMRTRWQEIIAARDEMSETARVWSPLTKAFQGLEFRFLNNVDAGFAQRIREDGRLSTFRGLLRKVGKGANEIKDLGALDSFARDCKDELTAEHHKAEAEWSKIDEDFRKWAGTGILGAVMSGHFIPNLASFAVGTTLTIGQLFHRYLKQQQFRKLNPMSVFIDLSRYKPPGDSLV